MINDDTVYEILRWPPQYLTDSDHLVLTVIRIRWAGYEEEKKIEDQVCEAEGSNRETATRKVDQLRMWEDDSN